MATRRPLRDAPMAGSTAWSAIQAAPRIPQPIRLAVPILGEGWVGVVNLPLYFDLDPGPAAGDRACRGLHDRDRPPRLLRQDRQRLAPRDVVGQVAVEAGLVAGLEGERLLV